MGCSRPSCTATPLLAPPDRPGGGASMTSSWRSTVGIPCFKGRHCRDEPAMPTAKIEAASTATKAQ